MSTLNLRKFIREQARQILNERFVPATLDAHRTMGYTVSFTYGGRRHEYYIQNDWDAEEILFHDAVPDEPGVRSMDAAMDMARSGPVSIKLHQDRAAIFAGADL